MLQKDHPVTEIEGPATREQCKKLGLEYHEIVPKDRRELSEAVALLADKVDLIIISNCVVAFDNVTAILPEANKRRVPIFSYEAKAVQRGAVAGIAASDEKLGRLLADSVVDVVVKGKPIAEVPVKMDPAPRFLVNAKMLRSLGLTFPEHIMEKAELIE